jgi:TPR repeat protein
MKNYLLILLACASFCASAQVSLKVREVTADDVVNLYKQKAYGPAREVAIQCAEKSADVNCQLHAAEFLLAGVGGPVDATRAAEFLKASSEQGSPAAQALLGNLYFHGTGVKQDRSESIKWWEMSATNCNTWAQNAVARTLFEGEVVPKDLVASFHWVSVAAHFKFAGAQDGVEAVRPLLTKEQLAQAEQRTAEFIKKSGCGSSKPVVRHEP